MMEIELDESTSRVPGFLPNLTLLEELAQIDAALAEGKATPEQENREGELVALADAAPAQALLLDLIRHGVVTINDSEVEFHETVYAYDPYTPDWNALMDAIGWDNVRAAIAKAEGDAV